MQTNSCSTLVWSAPVRTFAVTPGGCTHRVHTALCVRGCDADQRQRARRRAAQETCIILPQFKVQTPPPNTATLNPEPSSTLHPQPVSYHGGAVRLPERALHRASQPRTPLSRPATRNPQRAAALLTPPTPCRWHSTSAGVRSELFTWRRCCSPTAIWITSYVVYPPYPEHLHRIQAQRSHRALFSPSTRNRGSRAQRRRLRTEWGEPWRYAGGYRRVRGLASHARVTATHTGDAGSKRGGGGSAAGRISTIGHIVAAVHAASCCGECTQTERGWTERRWATSDLFGPNWTN